MKNYGSGGRMKIIYEDALEEKGGWELVKKRGIWKQ